jgi:hypothetical protein
MHDFNLPSMEKEIRPSCLHLFLAMVANAQDYKSRFEMGENYLLRAALRAARSSNLMPLYCLLFQFGKF